MSLQCTEGELLMWWTGHWDARACPASWDPSLRCGERRRNLPFAQFNFIICESSDSLGQMGPLLPPVQSKC